MCIEKSERISRCNYYVFNNTRSQIWNHDKNRKLQTTRKSGTSSMYLFVYLKAGLSNVYIAIKKKKYILHGITWEKEQKKERSCEGERRSFRRKLIVASRARDKVISRHTRKKNKNKPFFVVYVFFLLRLVVIFRMRLRHVWRSWGNKQVNNQI